MSDEGPGSRDRTPSAVAGSAAAGRSDERTEAGLCALCRHARVQASSRGNRFWRCARAGSDPGYLRYPPLPVTTCPGHETLRP